MPIDGCPFCQPDAARIFHSGDLVLGLWDNYPVSPGHALLVPRRHVRDWFEASDEERRALTDGIGIAREAMSWLHSPTGFNIGINVGAVAGQTVPHLHLHIIPRYAGDVVEPRAGVRNVIPGRGPYDVSDDPVPVVHDRAADYEPRWALSTSSDARVADPVTVSDSAAFGERLLQLLDEGRRTATYKYAVLLALVDLCLELGPQLGGEVAISTSRLAERVLELYWPQTAPYAGDQGQLVLNQNTSGQAEIVSQVRRFRERAGVDPSEPLTRARLRDPDRFEWLLETVEWKLIEMPLPRLQVVGNTRTEFLYRIEWDDRVRRQDIDRQGFDRKVYLRPGVHEQLVRLSGLLRPLIQQAWTTMVVKMNRDATDEARLIEFLFGAARIALDPVRSDLREMQDNRCFYCNGRITGPADVDHFIPWVRHPDNGIENLVVADPRCNNSKRDFLAAGDHLARWAARFEPPSPTTALAEIAVRAGWESHPTRTFETARSIYSRLPDDVRLWLDRSNSVAVAAQRAALNRTLRLGGP